MSVAVEQIWAQMSTRRARAWVAAASSALLVVALGAIQVVGGTASLIRPLQLALIVCYAIAAALDLRVAAGVLIVEVAVAGASGRWTVVAGPLTGRVVLEAILFLYVVVALVRERNRRLLFGVYGRHAVAVAVCVPAVWMAIGLARGNALRDVVGDGNGVAVFALALVVEYVVLTGGAQWLRQWFFVACGANAVVTGALVLVTATHVVSLTPTLSNILVDKLAAGNVVGYMPNGAYRLYLASALFLPMFVALLTQRLLVRPRSFWLWCFFAVTAGDLVATYTRGIWVSAIVAFAIVAVLGARSPAQASFVTAGAVVIVALGVGIGYAFSFSLPSYVLRRTQSIVKTAPQKLELPTTIQNGGFEHGVSPWIAEGGVSTASTGADAYAGRRTLRLGVSAAGADAYVAQVVRARPRTAYLVEAHARRVSVRRPPPLDRGLVVWDVITGNLYSSPIPAGRGWETVRQVIRTGSRSAALQIRLYGAQGTVDWDAVSMSSRSRRVAAAGRVAPPQRVPPVAVSSVVSASTQSDTAGAVSNAIRRTQARVLLHHIEQRPLFGSGFGSIARDYPYGHTYSYELEYLSIAFKTGVVGLLLVLSLPLRIARDSVWIRIRRRRSPEGVSTHAAIVALAIVAIVLVTALANPVIEASFGVLPIVLAIAWIDPSRSTDPPADGRRTVTSAR